MKIFWTFETDENIVTMDEVRELYEEYDYKDDTDFDDYLESAMYYNNGILYPIEHGEEWLLGQLFWYIDEYADTMEEYLIDEMKAIEKKLEEIKELKAKEN